MTTPLLSIITVTRNDISRLTRTYNSITKCIGKCPIEWVVIDGKSSDSTNEWLITTKNSGVIPLTIRSECDTGIYDAMNKGISLAGGEFVLFLNCGDLLLGDALAMLHLNCAASSTHDIVIFEYFVQDNGRRILRKPKAFTYFTVGVWGTSALCHQAIATRRIKTPRFDTSFSIKGDLLWYSALLSLGPSCTSVPCPIVIYDRFGMAASHPVKNITEAYTAFVRGFGLTGFFGWMFYVLRFTIGMTKKSTPQ